MFLIFLKYKRLLVPISQGLLFFMQLIACFNHGFAATRQNVINQIRLQDTTRRIYLSLYQKSLYKIIQVEQNKMIIAFKDVGISDNIIKKGSSSSFIQNIRIEKLQDNVTMLVIKTAPELIKTDADWDGLSNTLVVNFYFEKQRHKKRSPLKKKPDKKQTIYQSQTDVANPKEIIKEPESINKEIVEEPESIRQEVRPDPPSDLRGGSIDDIVIELSAESCLAKSEFKKAFEEMKNEEWKSAEIALTGFLESNANEACRDPAYFLKSYCSYKKMNSDKEENILESIAICQEAVNYFPDSKYQPYGMAILGKLYLKLNNIAEANGYFKIVLDKYPQYSGTPEIILELGILKEEKNDPRSAIEHFEKILSKYPKSVMVADARLEIGKTLFKMNNFSKVIEHLNLLINDYPQKIYDSSEVLLFIGNSYYHMGKYQEARKILEKAYNLYPEIDSSHIVLTRIADTLADENQNEKAKKLYQLVIDKYPGTDGFVISSVRLAKYLETREEKEKIYKLIIEDYPENPMANLAKLRIAEIQNKAGEYKQSIVTINDLFLANPRALKQEALFLKQNSFESLFKWMLEKGNYPEVLSMYEKDKRSLDTFENPGLFSLVGESYFQGHLYEGAAKLLLEAENHTRDTKKPDKYTYMLGVALQESGDIEKAIIHLNRYIRENPKSEFTSDAFRRIARIENQKKNHQKASQYLQTAFDNSLSEIEKADILIEHANLYMKNSQYNESSTALIKAINILSSSPKSDKTMILTAYRELGKSYMVINEFLKAADAFSMAIKFSETDEDQTSLNFLLGESLSKGNHLQEASRAYQNVVSSGDSFWSKLAAEKLKGLQLTEKIKNT
jgi:TolA-binding protein